jgi:hypothetical protein
LPPLSGWRSTPGSAAGKQLLPAPPELGAESSVHLRHSGPKRQWSLKSPAGHTYSPCSALVMWPAGLRAAEIRTWEAADLRRSIAISSRFNQERKLAADSLSNNKPIHEHASEQPKHEVEQTGPHQVVTWPHSQCEPAATQQHRIPSGRCCARSTTENGEQQDAGMMRPECMRPGVCGDPGNEAECTGD